MQIKATKQIIFLLCSSSYFGTKKPIFNFLKDQQLERSCAESFTSCAEVFKLMVQESSKGTGLLQIMEKRSLEAETLQNKKPRQQQETVNSCTQNTLESKIDIELTVYTCQTKINGTSHMSRDH